MHISDDLPRAVSSADTARDLDGLVAALYPELRRLARHERLRAGAAATLQTTALLNEAYLKLSGHAGWQTQAHFLGVAAKAMRHVLVDAARDRLALKRGAGIRPESLEAAENIADERKADDEMIRLGEALESLGTYDPMQNPATVAIDNEKLQGWIAKGAQPTETVASLIKKYAAVADAVA